MQPDYITDVHKNAGWRVSNEAVLILNIKDKTLFAKIKRLGIEKQVGLKLKDIILKSLKRIATGIISNQLLD